jgi:hypothetical protein
MSNRQIVTDTRWRMEVAQVHGLDQTCNLAANTMSGSIETGCPAGGAQLE